MSTALTLPAALPVRDRSTRTGHRLSHLVVMWLESFPSAHTRTAYADDLWRFLEWCARSRTDPLTQVRAPEMQAYIIVLRRGQHWAPLSESSINRKVAAVSSFYRFLAASGVVDDNPARHVKRLPVETRPETRHVSTEQARAMLAAAADYRHRHLGEHAAECILAALMGLGVRVSELTEANIGHLGWQNGHEVLAIRMKGAKKRLRPLPTRLGTLLRAHWAERGNPSDGPLVASLDGSRLRRLQAYYVIRQVAKRAGIEHWDRLSPHSMRHTFNTTARQLGISLENRQEALGHASPITTQLYDHAAITILDDPAHEVIDALLGD